MSAGDWFVNRMSRVAVSGMKDEVLADTYGFSHLGCSGRGVVCGEGLGAVGMSLSFCIVKIFFGGASAPPTLFCTATINPPK